MQNWLFQPPIDNRVWIGFDKPPQAADKSVLKSMRLNNVTFRSWKNNLLRPIA